MTTGEHDLPAWSSDARFHARVRELAAMHGPADALEPDRACRVAAEVLFHGLIEANNRTMAGAAVPILAEVETLPAAVREAVGVLVDATLAGRIVGAGQAGVRIAHARFRRARHPSFLDTDEILPLVATAHAVALEIYRRDPEVARRMVEGPAAG